MQVGDLIRYIRPETYAKLGLGIIVGIEDWHVLVNFPRQGENGGIWSCSIDDLQKLY